jgi:hypothetical protein
MGRATWVLHADRHEPSDNGRSGAEVSGVDSRADRSADANSSHPEKRCASCSSPSRPAIGSEPGSNSRISRLVCFPIDRAWPSAGGRS